jgi:hypothetical protein
MDELEATDSEIQYTYGFDEHNFNSNWKHGPDEGSTSIPLDQLSSHYSLSQGRPDGFVGKLERAVAFIAAAIIIYFSEFNESIPLLAPALFVYGAVRTLNLRRDLIPKTWTIIRYKNGESAGSIIHNGDSVDRKKFETALSQAIEHTNEISS